MNIIRSLRVISALGMFSFLSTSLSEAADLIRLHCHGYTNRENGFRVGIHFSREPVSLGDAVPMLIEIQSDTTSKSSLESIGTLTLHMERDGWQRSVKLEFSWGTGTELRSYFASTNLEPYLVFPGRYFVDIDFRDETKGIDLGGADLTPIQVMPSEVPHIRPPLPQMISREYSEIIFEDSSESNSGKMSVVLPRGVLNRGEELIAQVELIYNGKLESAKYPAYIMAHLEREGWSKSMQLTLYNLEEIVVSREKPFTYKFNISERLDIDDPGEYKVSFSCLGLKTGARKVVVW